jgi:hypothetical protein
LEGAVAFLKERKTLDLLGMCCGKINMEDMKKLSEAGRLKKDQIVIPKYMENMDEYMRALDIIAKTNHIDELDSDGDLESPAFRPETGNDEIN